MSTLPGFALNVATASQVAKLLRSCNDAFVPPLGSRVDIAEYADKIVARADRLEAWVNSELVGLAAIYCNDLASMRAFITSVSVLDVWQGRGIASKLVAQCIDHARRLGFARIELEVDGRNLAAIRLYEKYGFTACKNQDVATSMYLDLE